jgi:cell division septation protein DedD
MSLLHQDDAHDEPERELTLSTGALLGIFAGLVLLCALFFALGYTLRGRQGPRPTVAAAPEERVPSSPANFGSFKPAAGSPVAAPTPVAAPEPAAPVPAAEAPDAAAPAVREPAPVSRPSVTPVAHSPAPAAVPAVVPPGSFIVQVAAVSHPEDAEYVVAALKAKGYPAAARTEPQDKLFHIQVGPYADRRDAEAIKQRLSADGYNNPIVK